MPERYLRRAERRAGAMLMVHYIVAGLIVWIDKNGDIDAMQPGKFQSVSDCHSTATLQQPPTPGDKQLVLCWDVRKQDGGDDSPKSQHPWTPGWSIPHLPSIPMPWDNKDKSTTVPQSREFCWPPSDCRSKQST
jgi:hypothetical protein